MRFAHFISEAIKHPKQVGTFTQSSKYLARIMVREINGTTNVIEFGPGPGCVTTEILKRLPRNGRLTCFEINPNFCRHLRKIDDPRLKVINDDAENCQHYVGRPDCIVSGLPLALLGRKQREKIILLSSNSKIYIQLQYTPFLTKKMKCHFQDVKIKFVPLNFPPAFVYICKTPVE